MSKKTLKAKFETGKKPTGVDFASLIDESVQDLSTKQDKGDYATSTQLGKKADKTYVDDELDKKANSSSLTSKASQTDLDELKARVLALEEAGGGE